MVDLLRGAAQGDDLARTPDTAVEHLSSVIAQIRTEHRGGDPIDVRAPAAVALAEVLSPSSEAVDLREVLARCAFTAVESWEQHRVLDFLVDTERLVAAA